MTFPLASPIHSFIHSLPSKPVGVVSHAIFFYFLVLLLNAIQFQLSKYSIAFHAGTDLQPLTEVQYETISIVNRSSNKATFEVHHHHHHQRNQAFPFSSKASAFFVPFSNLRVVFVSQIEVFPASKWPEYKFTVYPTSGVLKKVRFAKPNQRRVKYSELFRLLSRSKFHYGPVD
jgi:hypothetical protein